MNGVDVHGGSVAAKLSVQRVESHGCRIAPAALPNQGVRWRLGGAVFPPKDGNHDAIAVGKATVVKTAARAKPARPLGGVD
jgi:hypothetical protein